VNGFFASLAPKNLIKNWTENNSMCSMMCGKWVDGSQKSFALFLNTDPNQLRPFLNNGPGTPNPKFLLFDAQGFTPAGCQSPYSLFCNNIDQTPTFNYTPLTDTYFWNYILEGFYMSVDWVSPYIKVRFYDKNYHLFFNFVGVYTFSNSNTYLFQWYNNSNTYNFKYGIISSTTKIIKPSYFDLSF
jgi:hypothetical protein